MKLPPRLFAILAFIWLGLAKAAANHVHLQVAWRANALVLEIYDFEAGAFPSDAFPFVISNAGMNCVPADGSFSFLGESGATFFALPQDDNPALAFLGIGVNAIPTGTFTGNRLRLRMVSITGPGRFALYQVNAFGQPSIKMNSADGTNENDDIDLATGAHEHLNWAFNAPGEYQITFVAEATRQSTGQLVAGAPANYRFRVLSPPKTRILLQPGPAADQPGLKIQSRPGARLQLLEAIELGGWTTNSTLLLTTPEWELSPQPSTATQRFWHL